MERRTVERIAWSLWGLAPALLAGGSSYLYQPINPQLGRRALLRCPRLGMSRPLHAWRLDLVGLHHSLARMAGRPAALGGSLGALSSTGSGPKILGHPAPESTS